MCEPSIAPIIPGIPERASKARAHCSNPAMESGNLINSGVSLFTTEDANNRTHRRVLASEAVPNHDRCRQICGTMPKK
jgi:hypothetical protein